MSFFYSSDYFPKIVCTSQNTKLEISVTHHLGPILYGRDKG